MPTGHPCLEVFVRCADAIRANKLINRETRQDKEFHFQNWFKARLGETGLNFELGGRNTYPDFRLFASTDGFEVKGLAYHGREANYDCNSQSRIAILKWGSPFFVLAIMRVLLHERNGQTFLNKLKAEVAASKATTRRLK